MNKGDRRDRPIVGSGGLIAKPSFGRGAENVALPTNEAVPTPLNDDLSDEGSNRDFAGDFADDVADEPDIDHVEEVIIEINDDFLSDELEPNVDHDGSSEDDYYDNDTQDDDDNEDDTVDGQRDPLNTAVAPRTSAEQRAERLQNPVSIDALFDFLPGQEHHGDGERLQKVLARTGVGSRRIVEDLIVAKRVRVNGEIAVLGRRVDPERDQITVDGAPIGTAEGLVYYLLNKPVGVVTTAYDPQSRETVVQLVPEEPRVYPVGRLDVETEGLLILTNDGELAHRLTHPSYGVAKEYLAEVRGEISQSTVRTLRTGVQLEDGWTAPAEVSLVAPNLVKIEIHEGRNRQVRRMLDAVGHPVTRLARIRIDRVTDRQLRPGAWRELTSSELALLRQAVSGSPIKDDPRFRKSQ
jgi:23S rRNA pseudouridine2605 synthase